MKQGTLINRIVMLLLLAAVLVYLGVSAWRSFRDPYTLVLSYAYTVDDSLEATGFLVREERVLASPGGIVDLLPEEGEKVSRGETVALLYQNDSGLARKEELQSLTMEKEQLQYALERTQSGGDSSQLSQQVIDASWPCAPRCPPGISPSWRTRPCCSRAWSTSGTLPSTAGKRTAMPPPPSSPPLTRWTPRLRR